MTGISYYMRTLMALVGLVALTACMEPIHDSGSRWGLASSCDASLKVLFEQEFHSFLKTNCASCHSSGGSGKGAFADSDVQLAFGQFQTRGFESIAERATDPNHKPPYTGPQHQERVQFLTDQWAEMKAATPSCSGGDVADDIRTIEKPLAPGLEEQTLSWDLGASVLEGYQALVGARVQLTFTRIQTEDGQTHYEISNPVFKAGGQSLQVEGLFINISSLNEEVTTFESLKRAVPAGKERALASVSSLMSDPFGGVKAPKVSLAFRSVVEVQFDPPTYQELVASDGVLGQHCLSCHNSGNPQGGLNLENPESLRQKMLVVPYLPGVSGLLIRMSSASSPMPPQGVLDLDDRKRVMDWIIDGAPSE